MAAKQTGNGLPRLLAEVCAGVGMLQVAPSMDIAEGLPSHQEAAAGVASGRGSSAAAL